MENLEIYNKLRAVPQTAKKEIQAGRLRGKTDINPMWRIKVLTEQFGVSGVGWKTVVVNKWLEKGANDEIAAFVDIELFVKVDGQWSDGIQGTGGSMFVSKEKSGMYVSDECFKMAYTDAISVACKALGIGADVYWEQDKTKYDVKESAKENIIQPTKEQLDKLLKLGGTVQKVATYFKVSIEEVTSEMVETLIASKEKANAKKAEVPNDK